MTGYTYSANRKVHQRKLNRGVRALNKNIANDSLWKGRFVVQQLWTDFNLYEDHSGGYLFARLIVIDKKTGKGRLITGDVNDLVGPFGKLFWEVNEFITKDCDVWREEDPYLDKTDYTTWTITNIKPNLPYYKVFVERG